MEWFGIPWWVWVFVFPEVVFTVIFVVIVLPATGISALVERRRERRERD